MEDVQKFPGMNTLASGRLHKRWDDAVVFQSGVRAGDEADLPEYHHLSQSLLGVVIGGRDARNTQEGREVCPFWPADSGALAHFGAAKPRNQIPLSKCPRTVGRK
jgi:hypothetical protein